MSTWLDTFKKWDAESRKQWGMAWHGSRQDDSPAGRLADKKALDAFSHLSDDDKASLDPETRLNYEATQEQESLIS